MIGNRFGTLTVVDIQSKDKYYNILYKCICDCGKERFSLGGNLRRIKGTGCLSCTRKTHEHTNSRTYRSWTEMKRRCTKAHRYEFRNYGGRGITVCVRWFNSFENFLADMGERPSNKTLDRINNDGNYEPGNCRWATPLQQRHNQRELKKAEGLIK